MLNSPGVSSKTCWNDRLYPSPTRVMYQITWLRRECLKVLNIPARSIPPLLYSNYFIITFTVVFVFSSSVAKNTNLAYNSFTYNVSCFTVGTWYYPIQGNVSTSVLLPSNRAVRATDHFPHFLLQPVWLFASYRIISAIVESVDVS